MSDFLSPQELYVSGHDWSRLLVSTRGISSMESARHSSRGEKSLTDAQPARVRRTRVASSLRKISFSRNEVRGRSLSRITHSGDCFYTICKTDVRFFPLSSNFTTPKLSSRGFFSARNSRQFFVRVLTICQYDGFDTTEKVSHPLDKSAEKSRRIRL